MGRDEHSTSCERYVRSNIDFEQAKGFGIYMIKGMLNGRGDETLDLASTNLRAFF